MKCCGWVRQFSGISFYPLLVLERFIFRSLTLCLDRRGEELGLDTGCFGIRCYLAACSCCSPGKCCCLLACSCCYCCCSDNCCLTELCSWSVVVCSLGCCCSCSEVAGKPGCCCCCCSCLVVCSCCCSCCSEVCSPGCYNCCWEVCSLGCSCFLVVGIPGTGLEGTSSSHQKGPAKTCDNFCEEEKVCVSTWWKERRVLPDIVFRPLPPTVCPQGGTFQ